MVVLYFPLGKYPRPLPTVFAYCKYGGEKGLGMTSGWGVMSLVSPGHLEKE